MPNTTVNVSIDARTKENAERILAQQGITPAEAIQLFYDRVIRSNGMPFKQPGDLPAPGFLFEGAMTREELDRELQKGYDSARAGNVYTLDEVDQMFYEEFGI